MSKDCVVVERIPYSQQVCYFDQFAPKCGGCHTPITENYISSLNLQVRRNIFLKGMKLCSEFSMLEQNKIEKKSWSVDPDPYGSVLNFPHESGDPHSESGSKRKMKGKNKKKCME